MEPKRDSGSGRWRLRFLNIPRLPLGRLSCSVFGLAAVYRVIKKAGAERVGDDAAFVVPSEQEALGVKISKRAVTLANHGGWKSGSTADI